MQTILVIEDDPAIAGMLHVLLQMEGYHVITATQGDHGLDLLRQLRST